MRFQDKNVTLSHFENEVFVQCPKCSKRATVSKDAPISYDTPRTLKCSNCFYSQKGRKETYSVELKCSCSHCASELIVSMPNVNNKKDTLAIKCNKCGNTEEYRTRNIPQEWRFESGGQPCDSYFGLPLWLSENFKGNTFWALNYYHLQYLREYITADLRERNNRHGWTMVEKLPDWMKSAKNRIKLTKIILGLEKK